MLRAALVSGMTLVAELPRRLVGKRSARPTERRKDRPDRNQCPHPQLHVHLLSL
jgi:hypothetical protein